jgi:PII-like signaling protein
MLLTRPPHCVLRRHAVVGELRIYFTQADKHTAPGLRSRPLPDPLAHALVDKAHAFGILQATTHTSGYGYVLSESVRARHLEVESGQLAQCMELLDERARLLAFCQQHQELLRGKVVIFRPVEQWDVVDNLLEGY